MVSFFILFVACDRVSGCDTRVRRTPLKKRVDKSSVSFVDFRSAQHTGLLRRQDEASQCSVSVLLKACSQYPVFQFVPRLYGRKVKTTKVAHSRYCAPRTVGIRIDTAKTEVARSNYLLIHKYYYSHTTLTITTLPPPLLRYLPLDVEQTTPLTNTLART